MTLYKPTSLKSAWINGQSVVCSATFDVLNPATGELVAKAPDCELLQFEAALTAAETSFVSWSQTPEQERANTLRKWAEVIEQSRDEVEHLLSAECGKLLREARHETSAALAAIRWAAARSVVGSEETVASSTPGKRHYTIKQPVGVVACITPWNFPVAAVLVKSAAALAAGCSVVLKPSEETPCVALLLAHLSQQAGFPDGIFNVVPTSQPGLFGDVVTQSKKVRAISFTRSTKVGKRLYAACAASVKRVALELGGNAPFIVYADADIDRAVTDAISARFYNSGQICVGANRFFIHESVYEQFRDKLCERVAAMAVGDGRQPSSEIGPMINRQAKNRIHSLVNDAVSKGAEVVVGGLEPDPGGLFINPTVVTNVSAAMDVYQQEKFGPVACLSTFQDEQTVVTQANDTDAGLVAYAYTRNPERLGKLVSSLEAGVVGLNSTQVFASDLPFGGIKESGIGREHGNDCLDEFMEVKSVILEQGDQS